MPGGVCTKFSSFEPKAEGICLSFPQSPQFRSLTFTNCFSGMFALGLVEAEVATR